jgi:endonuclease-3
VKVEENVVEILRLLRVSFPNVKGTYLNYGTPLELLVATILSAQCTDEKVNEVTESLFKTFRKPEDYASAEIRGLEEKIRPTGFYRRKAQFIKQTSKALVERFNSEVPRTMEELTGLEGVARKTANIVLSNAYGIVEGIAVDTHVLRLSRRLGLTESKVREKVEEDLMKITPRERWFELSNLLIAHGRTVCLARKPKCAECVLATLCPSAFTFTQT